MSMPAQAQDGAEARRNRLAVCERTDWSPEDGIDPCVEALAFDPTIYFGDEFYDGDPIDPFPNSVDARFWDPFNGIEWAFAIDYTCSQRANVCGEPHYLLRMISGRARNETPREGEYRAPQSKADAQRLLTETVKWQEADLNTCPGGLDHLRTLAATKWMPFPVWDYDIMRGNPGDPVEEIIITADGFTVEVRARTTTRSIAARDKGDEDAPGGWAIAMYELVQPCLKPSTAAPPWTR